MMKRVEASTAHASTLSSKKDDGQQVETNKPQQQQCSTDFLSAEVTTNKMSGQEQPSAIMKKKRDGKQEMGDDDEGATDGSKQELRYPPRPGAFHMYPSDYSPRTATTAASSYRDEDSSNNNDSDNREREQGSSAFIVDGEVYDEVAERDERERTLAEAREIGRQEAINEQLKQAAEQGGRVARAIPMGSSSNEEIEESNKKIDRPSSQNRRYKILVAAFSVIIIAGGISAAITIPLLNKNRKEGSSQPLALNPPIFQCFNNVTALYDAVDAYLINPTNSSHSLIYGADIANWCVSNIQIFDDLFSFQRNPLNDKFDADLSGWNMSAAKSIARMFNQARRFAGVGIHKWDVSNVEDMSAMFNGSTLFNANLSTWRVSRVTSMRHMFAKAENFDGIGIDQWNISNLWDLEGMFHGSSKFDANLSQWHLPPQVDSLRSVFRDANSFRGYGLDQWDVSNIVAMDYVFAGASNFNVNLSSWDVSRVTNMTGMFSGALNYTGSGSNTFNVSQVQDMSKMFKGAHTFDADLTTWNVSQVVNMESMFAAAFSFRGRGLDQWNVSNVQTMHHMFLGAKAMDANFSNWDVSRIVSLHGLFADCATFHGIGIEQWQVSNVQDMGWLFSGADLLPSLNLSEWNMSGVNIAAHMFVNTSRFLGIGLDKWNVSNVDDMGWMFLGARSIDVSLSSWNVSRVTDMNNMFLGASSFRGTGLDQWDVSRVIRMNGMFGGATLFDANLSNWHVDRVVTMHAMFRNASNFRGHGLDMWNVTHVNDTSYMLASAILFNSSLCNWGKQWSPLSSHVDTRMMFDGTLCPFTKSPDLSTTAQGPFCFSC